MISGTTRSARGAASIAACLGEGRDLPLASLIVTTKNSEKTIERCLRAALAQSVEVEVVVVDNYSEDRTREIAERLSCRVIVSGDERSRQRNVGAAAATTGWLLFLDADMVVSPQVVESCLSRCAATGASAVAIPQLATGRGFLARARAFEKQCYVGDQVLEAPRFVSADLFALIEGYDVNLWAGEDWDFSARIAAVGERVVHVSQPIVHLDDRIGVRETFHKMRYYAPSLLRYWDKHRNRGMKQVQPLRSAWRRHWRRIVRHPALFGGVLFLKVVEATGIAVGVVEARLRGAWSR